MQFLPGKCCLHALLRERKMTQQELADRVHMTRQQISNYANNENKMSLANAKTIAHALKVRIEDLYQWEHVNPAQRGRGGKE